MTRKRASIFEEPADLDVAGFAPKSGIDPTAPTPEQVKAIAESVRFRSREPAPPTLEAQFTRPARRYRTGRNVQFNVKAQRETVDDVYAIADAQGWVLGYTLQRAIEALKRELDNGP
jgi:hypothetical protein